MEIAKGFVVTGPENKLFRHDITPAESLIIHALHKVYSNGTPLIDLTVTGIAREINEYGHPVMVEKKSTVAEKVDHVINGQKVKVEGQREVVETYASDKERTNVEECNRLRRKYTGNIDGKPAFAFVFGTASIVQLPTSFNEVSDVIGQVFRYADGVTPLVEGKAGTKERSPTLEEFVTAGHPPFQYPPEGHAAVPSEALTVWRSTGKLPKELAAALKKSGDEEK